MPKYDFASIKISVNYYKRLLTSEGTGEVTYFSSVFPVKYSSSLERTIAGVLCAYWRVLTQTDYPLHSSLKFIFIIVCAGKALSSLTLTHSLSSLAFPPFSRHRKHWWQSADFIYCFHHILVGFYSRKWSFLSSFDGRPEAFIKTWCALSLGPNLTSFLRSFYNSFIDDFLTIVNYYLQMGVVPTAMVKAFLKRNNHIYRPVYRPVSSLSFLSKWTFIFLISKVIIWILTVHNIDETWAKRKRYAFHHSWKY